MIIERVAHLMAPPEAVWAYLADGARWAEWDPDISQVHRAEAVMQPGGRLDVTVGGLRGRIRFDSAEPPKSVEWSGRLLWGLMTTQADFTLFPRGGGHTRFHYRFGMAGPLGGLFQRARPHAVIHGMEGGLEHLTQVFGGRVLDAAPP